MRLGASTVLVADEWTETTFPDGRTCMAFHAEQPGQAARAAELGYPSAEAMNREHDVTHSLVAHWFGLGCSPTLYGMAIGVPSSFWREEEAVVLAVQRFARALGIDLVELARAQK